MTVTLTPIAPLVRRVRPRVDRPRAPLSPGAVRAKRAALAVLASAVLVVALFVVACVPAPTVKIYTQTFTRTTTIAISNAMVNNTNLGGGGAAAAAAVICQYVSGLPPVAAMCGAAVTAAYFRLNDVLGQIDRSTTEKCLKVEYHVAVVPVTGGFVNFFATECLPVPNQWGNGESMWTLDGLPIDVGPSGGAGGGGGGSW